MNSRTRTLPRSKFFSLLAGTAANVFAVGDPDQAIYQFRGASSEAFTLFVKNFPAARVVVLGEESAFALADSADALLAL